MFSWSEAKIRFKFLAKYDCCRCCCYWCCRCCCITVHLVLSLSLSFCRLNYKKNLRSLLKFQELVLSQHRPPPTAEELLLFKHNFILHPYCDCISLYNNIVLRFIWFSLCLSGCINFVFFFSQNDLWFHFKLFIYFLHNMKYRQQLARTDRQTDR